MNNWYCRHCNAELSTEGAPPFRAYRCSGCRQLNFFVNKGRQYAGQETAWRSLWLGIITMLVMIAASVLLFTRWPWSAGMLGLLAMATGAFALYFGIKPLLRNRYQEAPTSAKVAASSATVLGGCGGMFFGGFFGFVFLMVLVISMASVSTTEPNEVRLQAEKYFQIEMGDEISWVPADAEITPFISQVEYWDNKNFDDSLTRLYVSWIGAMLSTGPAANNQANLAKGVARGILGNERDNVGLDQTKTFEWEIMGDTRSVQRKSFIRKIDDGGPEFTVYQAIVIAESRTFAVTLMCTGPEELLDDEQAKQIFESFQVVQ